MPDIWVPRYQPARASPMRSSAAMKTVFSETKRAGMTRLTSAVMNSRNRLLGSSGSNR